MRWLAFINKRVDDHIETSQKKFYLPKTTRADSRKALLHAANLFKVSEKDVLVVPCCTVECRQEHSKWCNSRWLAESKVIKTKI